MALTGYGRSPIDMANQGMKNLASEYGNPGKTPQHSTSVAQKKNPIISNTNQKRYHFDRTNVLELYVDKDKSG